MSKKKLSPLTGPPIAVTPFRLFQVKDRKTGKRVGSYYDNKQKAKAARDPETMKVSVGPDHWRFKDGHKKAS